LSTSVFLLAATLVFLSLAHAQRFFLFLPLLCLLRLTHFVPALFLLVLDESSLCQLLRPFLIRAFRGGAPGRFCGFGPAFLAKIAGFGSIGAADATSALCRTSRLSRPGARRQK
jgi:hypothetical protein